MKRQLFISLVLLSAAVSAAPAAAATGALVRVDNPAPGTARRLLDAGVMVVHDAGGYILAVAQDGDRGWFDRFGLSYTRLDASVEGESYYTIARLRPERLEDAARICPVLHPGEYGAVVAANLEQADRLAQAGFDIARVFMRPITPAVARRAVRVPRAPTQPQPLIEAMVQSVSGPSIDAYVQRLQDFVTRSAMHDSCQAAADWIKREFESFGIDTVYFHHFSDFFKDNVVAVKPGKTTPEEIIIIGGHYDSVSNNPDLAPGADDNASGTACVLECARVMAAQEFDRTVMFIAFGAEEQGLMGSEQYAAAAAVRGDNIVAMINVDMIGYLAPGDVLDLDIVGNDPSMWLRDHAVSLAPLYVSGFPVVPGSEPSGAGSDNISFWNHGYHAIWLWEDLDYTPYLHTPADSIGMSYNEPFLAHQSTRVAVAVVADLAGPYDPAIGTDDAPNAPLLSLEQNVPNPFNPRTMIRFTVSTPGALASLRIYDVAGREVSVLLDDEMVVGSREVWWNGTSRTGGNVPSGVYFYRLTAGQQTQTRKLVLIR